MHSIHRKGGFFTTRDVHMHRALFHSLTTSSTLALHQEGILPTLPTTARHTDRQTDRETNVHIEMTRVWVGYRGLLMSVRHMGSASDGHCSDLTTMWGLHHECSTIPDSLSAS